MMGYQLSLNGTELPLRLVLEEWYSLLYSLEINT